FYRIVGKIRKKQEKKRRKKGKRERGKRERGRGRGVASKVWNDSNNNEIKTPPLLGNQHHILAINETIRVDADRMIIASYVSVWSTPTAIHLICQ
ncbi:hypothetical protein T310_10147, partial [Rasamsonia emersonii CBS 393.64]